MNRRSDRLGRLLPLALLPSILFLTRSVHARDDKSEPSPPPFPVHVDAEIDLIKVSKIDDRAETFEVEFFLNQTWTDPRLAFDRDKERASKRIVPLEEIWSPKIQLAEKIDASIESGTEAHISPTGRVLLHQAYKATVPVRFDLHGFPFDKHRLTLTFESPLYEAHEVIIRAKEIRLLDKVLDDEMPNGWNLKALTTASATKTYPSIDETYVRAQFQIQVQRDSHYYSWAVVLPLVLIVATAWTTFWMEPNDFSTQIGVVITALLTIVAFKISVDSSLPPLSYMTRIDLLFVLCQFSVFTTLLLCLAIKLLHTAANPSTRALSTALRLKCRWIPKVVLLACCLPIPWVDPSQLTLAVFLGLIGLGVLLRPSPKRLARLAKAVFHPEAYLDPTTGYSVATDQVAAVGGGSTGSASASLDRWTTTQSTTATSGDSRVVGPHFPMRFRRP